MVNPQHTVDNNVRHKFERIDLSFCNYNNSTKKRCHFLDVTLKLLYKLYGGNDRKVLFWRTNYSSWISCNSKCVSFSAPKGIRTPVLAACTLPGMRRTNMLSYLRQLCPQGDSNPCFGLERATSWATRQWGRLAGRFYHAHPVVSINGDHITRRRHPATSSAQIQ